MPKSIYSLCLLSLAIFQLSLFTFSQTPVSNDGDVFPENAVWVNSDNKVALETFRDKIVIVAITDENCVECAYYLQRLQESTLQMGAVQLLQVMKANSDSPVSKNHLVQFIQRNAITHPIGIFPDFSGFRSSKINALPYFLMYEKNTQPSLSGSGNVGYTNIMNRLKALREEKITLEGCSNYQVKPSIEPGYWANPIVETPTYLANQGDIGGLFVNDAAHHRLLGFDENGNMALLIGSTIPGFLDQGLFNSQFDHPHGMVYFEEKLFVADTYNHRVRIVNFQSEVVSTLLGNGFETWTKAEEIDGKFQPIGLPTDVEIWNNKLYVASAATGQIFGVDIKNGNAELLCDIPQDTASINRNQPINLSVVYDELFITTTLGKIYHVDKKGKIELFDQKEKRHVNAVCEWSGGLAAITDQGQLLLNTKDRWTVIGEGKDKKDKNMVSFGQPQDLMKWKGDLYVSDTDNHFVRIVSNPSDKLMKNFWIKVSPELIGFEPAHTLGEVVLMDSVFIHQSDIKISVLLDLHGYKIVPGGQNEALLSDVTGNVSQKTEKITSEEFTFYVKSTFTDPDIYVELYLTLEHPENPGLYIIKRAYLDFPAIVTEKASEAAKEQEQIYAPNLLPY